MSRWSFHSRPKLKPTYDQQGQLKNMAFVGTAVVASAALVNKEQVRSVMGRKGEWQTGAWDYYDDVPELRYGVSWTANACGRARLYVGRLDPDGSAEPAPLNISEDDTNDGDGDPEPTSRQDLEKLQTLIAPLNELAGGQTGQYEMLKRFAVHLNVPGESYLLGFDDPNTEERRWLVCSPDEVQSYGTKVRIKDPDVPGSDLLVPIAEATILRIWRPHPRFAHQPDSPVRALRGALRELLDLSAHINATAESRLAGAGVLFVPEELAIPKPQQTESEANPLHSDPFVASLIEAMAAPLKNRDSASAVVPLVVRGPASAGKEIKHISFATDFDERVQEMREQAVRRVAVGLDLPPEILTGTGDANHWCTLRHVRIMTRGGWKTHDQLVAGEEVLTLNHDTGLSEWQPLRAVNTWNVENEPMVHITGRRHSSTTTLNHRWPILSGKPGHRGRDWTTTRELMHRARESGENTQRQEYMVLGAPHAGLPAEPKYADALVELVAWYFTEGDLGVRDDRRVPKVVISQSHHVNPDNCARIERALTALFGQESDRFDKGGRYSTPESVARRAEARRLKAVRDAVPRWRRTVTREDRLTRYVLNSAAAEVILECAPRRVVKLDFIQQLTAAQLELFIDTAIRGDGYTMDDTTPVLGQKDPAMCDAFELACILSGRSVNRYNHTCEGRTANGPALKTQHKVTASTRSLTFAPRGRSFEETTYSGTIWCPTTPNGTWLAEDNGHVFFTGNSAWALEESAIKMHVEPLLGLLCDSLTTQFYQPALRAMGVEDWADYVIWYDTTELALRPNRAPEAAEAHARGVISEATYRREIGFTDEDAPHDSERAQALARQVALTNANLAPILLPKLGLPLTPEQQAQADPQGTPAPLGAVPNTDRDPAAPAAPAGTGGRGGRNEIPAQRGPQPLAAAGGEDVGEAWRMSCLDMAVRRALTKAGQYLFKHTSRSERVHLQKIEREHLHCRVAVDQAQLDSMLAGAFSEFYRATPNEPCLHKAIDTYVRALLTSGEEHRVEYLQRAIVQFGCG